MFERVIAIDSAGDTLGLAASSGGELLAGGAFALWGVLPLFYKALGHVPVLDVLAHRGIWALGNAGAEVPLTIVGREGVRSVTVTSGDRYDWLKLQPTY